MQFDEASKLIRRSVDRRPFSGGPAPVDGHGHLAMLHADPVAKVLTRGPAEYVAILAEAAAKTGS